MKKVFVSKGVVLFYIISMAFSYIAVLRIDASSNDTSSNQIVLNDVK